MTRTIVVSLSARRRGLLCGAAILALLAGPAWAGPQGATVVAGQAAVSTAGATTTVTQGSNRAIVNWKSFSVGAGETTRFVQPSSTAAILNRVTGADPSALMGQVSANGRVYLINPNGVVVGPNGRIDTAGFVASTLDVKDGDFLSGGSLGFSGFGGDIQVLGAIHAREGDVVLLGRKVSVAGTVSAPSGQALLAAGREVLYQPDGFGDILIQAPLEGARVDNTGVISAAAVQLRAAGGAYGLAINTSGAISATAVRNEGGRVVVEAETGDLDASGTVTAQAGDDGGQVRLLAAGTTRFTGAITARGGEQGGDGGFAEVSGGTLALLGDIDLRAPRGRGGRLLLDPADLSIDAVQAGIIDAQLDGGGIAQVQATHSLAVDAPISSLNVFASLELDAPTIAINQDISLPNGALRLTSDVPGTAPSVTSGAGVHLTADQIYIPRAFNNVVLAGPVTTARLIFEVNGTPGPVSVVNAANQIARVEFAGFDPFDNIFSGDFAVSSAGAMSIGGDMKTGGALTFKAGGDLTLESGASLDAFGVMTLASTGGAFVNAAGAAALSGAGRRRIYTKTVGAPFDDGGLGYPVVNHVNYPDDPNTGLANVIYIGFAGNPPMTITANGASRVYGQPDPTFSAFYSVGGPGDLTSPVRFRIDEASHANVGTYTIVPFGAASSTYDLLYVNGVLTVTRAPLLIKANDSARLFGENEPVFTASYTGLVNGDTSAAVTNLTFSTPAHAASPVGTYDIDVSGGIAANYTLSYVPGVLTVAAAPLMITANSFSRVYGEPDPAFSASYGGGSASDLTSPVQFRILQGSDLDVGAYTIVPFGAASSTHVLSYVNGTLTVARAPLVITANSASRAYGVSNPAFTGSYSGLVNGDTAQVVTGLGYSTPATVSSPVGTYAVTPFGGLAANYVISYVPGALSIGQALLTITVDPASRFYGRANPTFTASYSGFLNGDDASMVSGLAFSTPATSASVIGTYPVTASGASAGNYAIDYVPGTLTIAKAPLVVGVEDAARRYGDPNPTFVPTFIGLVNGDGPSVVSGLSIVGPPAASGVGTYSVTAHLGEAANYDIGYTSGRLTITPRPLQIFVNSIQSFSGAPLPAFSATYVNLSGFDPDPTRLGLSFVADGGAFSPPGSYAIRARFEPGALANYDVTLVRDGTLDLVYRNLLQTTDLVLTNVNIDNGSPVIVTMEGDLSSIPDAQRLKKVFEVHDTRSCNFGGCPSLTGPAAAEFSHVISKAVRELAGRVDPPLTVDEIKRGLANPDTAPAVMAGLMVFVYQDLDTILDKDPDKWTDDQSAFVDAITAFIQDQRRAAAAKAMADYQAWALQEFKNRQEQMASVSGGVAGVYYAGVLSTDPPLPPDSLMQEMQVGMVMTNKQLSTIGDINVAMGEINKGMRTYTGGDIAIGVETLAESFRVGSGVAALAGAVSSGELVQTIPALGKILPFAEATAVRGGGKALFLLKEAKASLKTAMEAGDVAKTVKFQAEVAEYTARAEKAGLDVAKSIETGVEVVSVTKGVGALKGLQLMEAIPVVGEVIAIVGDWVTVALAVNQYRAIGDYNVAFSNTYNELSASFTVADLKAMAKEEPTKMYSYLALMSATNGSAPPVIPKATMSLKQISTLSMAQ